MLDKPNDTLNHAFNDTQIDTLALVHAQAHHAPNRRAALRGALGVGFAAAVLPVMAQSTIRTSSEGLDSGEITVVSDGDDIPVFFARPQGKTGVPVVLVVSEIFGVHEHIADVCRRFAKQGYLALAPEPFIRHGDAQGFAQIATLIKEVVSKVPDAQFMRDLDACVAWAQANGGDTQRLGITGFCWGGRQVWLYAAHQPKVRAGVAWYGRLVGQATPNTPKQPLDVAAQMKGPVLGLYGGADTGIPLDTVDKMKQALAQAGQAGNRAAADSAFVVYPEAPHAFHADYRGSYRAEAAKDGWRRALAWFAQHGVA